MSAITISFLNNKGGCGKTTTVCAVGQAWAREGKKVLFVDLDSQANLTSMVTNTDPTTAEWDTTIEHVLECGPDFIHDAIHHVAENIDIIPADLELSMFEQQTLQSETPRQYLLKQTLGAVKDKYDFILVDCPPALTLIITNALVASDYIVIVTTPDRPSHEGIKYISKAYERVQGNEYLNPNIDILGVVITKFEEKNNVCNAFVRIIKKEVGIDKEGGLVVSPIIHKAAKIQAAMSLQVSLYDYDKSGRASREYAELSANLYRRVVEAERVKKHNTENK